MKIAIVHDWLTNMGGAEKLVESFHRLYPDAPVYTLLYSRDNMPAVFAEMDIRTSYLQRIPLARNRHQWLLQLMPTAVEQFDLSGYDVVLSSSTCCAKGVITRPDTCHICYCSTPMRYAWDYYSNYIEGRNSLARMYIAYQMNRLRMWDRLSADRVDFFLANSKFVARRINKHYRREARVIYPPVDTAFFTPGGTAEAAGAAGPEHVPGLPAGLPAGLPVIPGAAGFLPGDYFLCAGRLVGYKMANLAVETFNNLGLPLLVAGSGPLYGRLKKMAGPSVRVLGRVSNQQLLELYRGCKAFIFPGEEDFGIAPLEAQACGRPVIAFGSGGALETVLPGLTGLFFEKQDAASLAKAVNKFVSMESEFNPGLIRQHAEGFNEDRFRQEVEAFVKARHGEWSRNIVGKI